METLCGDEYDGAEGWEFARPFILPNEQKSISRLVVSKKKSDGKH